MPHTATRHGRHITLTGRGRQGLHIATLNREVGMVDRGWIRSVGIRDGRTVWQPVDYDGPCSTQRPNWTEGAPEMTAITVRDLIMACAENGVSPAAAVVLIEREIPVPATEAEPTVMVDGNGRPSFGLLIAAPDHD